LLLAALLQHGELAGQYVPMLERADFPTAEQQAVFDAIARLVGQAEPVTAEAVLAEVEADARELLAQLSLEEVPPEQLERSLQSAVRRIVGARLQRRERALEQRLTGPLTAEEREALRLELNEVTRRRSELAGQRIVGEE
jgi:replicative DNA helicase